MEYSRYEAEHAEIFDTETSDRAFEEETLIVGFGNAEVKAEGAGVRFDTNLCNDSNTSFDFLDNIYSYKRWISNYPRT